MRTWATLLCVVALTGCTTRLGSAPLLGPGAGAVGTKLLRPGARGRSCRTTILGLPLGSGSGTLDEAVAALLAQDAEGDVVTDAVLEEEQVTTGVVNRRCLVVRGDLGRRTTTVTLPTGEEHHGHGMH
jgi:hypothetical protein